VRVLLVEDDPNDVVRVNAVLDRAAASSFTVRAVAAAPAAVQELAAASYDLVLLGLARPALRDGSGFEAIRGLGKALPVIVLSGYDDEDIAVKAVQRGAQDYLVKESLTVDLLVRSIRYARERHRLLAEQNRRLEHELKIAAFVQQSFLPGSVPQVPGHDIGAHLDTSGQVGGDFYDFIDLPPDRVAIALGDASGKGIPGAILMAETQGILRAEAATCATPVELVSRLNRALLRDQSQDRFVTLFYGVLAIPTGRFTFVNAGHPRALLLDGATESALVSTGPPVRLFADAAWEEQTVTLGAGSRLVIYSDGVTEAQDTADEFFDLAGLRGVLSEHLDCPAAELARNICHAAEEFERESGDPGDDKTVVVIRSLDG
jgi:sigma-B regulation protein RsbU (phosphoserine phosphatase)